MKVADSRAFALASGYHARQHNRRHDALFSPFRATSSDFSVTTTLTRMLIRHIFAAPQPPTSPWFQRKARGALMTFVHIMATIVKTFQDALLHCPHRRLLSFMALSYQPGPLSPQ
jgi:hypothetical protein